MPLKMTDKFVFFWKEWPSNFKKTRFIHEIGSRTLVFTSSEQAFQFEKAAHFGDEEIEGLILDSDSPQAALILGNRVRNFDADSWDRVRRHVMYKVVLDKYSQDMDLLAMLTDPVFDGKEFIEASPHDTFWGIGMDASDPDINDDGKWKGSNQLGKILTQVRYELIERMRNASDKAKNSIWNPENANVQQ